MPYKEYIEREAIQKRLNRIVEVNNLRTDLAWFTPYGVNALIEEIPAADVRPVVFCKDCRHRDPEDHKCDCGRMERQGCPFKVADDYFCAYGER